MPRKSVRNSYRSRRRKGQSASRKKSSPSETKNPTLENSKTTSSIHGQHITSTSSDRNNAVSNMISQETYEIENNNDKISGNSDDVCLSDDNVIEEEIQSTQNSCTINAINSVACDSNNNQNDEVRNLDMELLNEDIEDTNESLITQSQNDDIIDGNDDEVDVLPTYQHTQSFDNDSVESDDDAIAEGHSSVSSVSSTPRMKKLRAKASIISSLTSFGTFPQQCSLLKSVLSSPELEMHVNELKIQNSEDQVKIESFDHLAKCLSFSSSKKKGNLNFHKKGFQDSVLASIVKSDTNTNMDDDQSSTTSNQTSLKPSFRNKVFSDHFAISPRTVRRRLKKAAEKRNEIASSSSSKSWLKVPVKKGHTKITPHIINSVREWVMSHDHVKKSSSSKDSIQVRVDGSNEKVVMPKYYLQLPIRELHAQMIKPQEHGGLNEVRDDNGKVIVSEYSLRKILPKNIKPMSKQKRLLCGCESCITADLLQSSLNAWRQKHLKRLEHVMNSRSRLRLGATYIYRWNRYKDQAFPGGNVLHTKASRAAFSTMCPFPVENIDIPKWHCVLKCCRNCPSLLVPDEEKTENAQSTKIKFHVYRDVSRCSICGVLPFDGRKLCMTCNNQADPSLKGRLHTKKEIVLLEETITSFHQNYYMPSIEKLAYHLAHVRILGSNHVGLTRKQALMRRGQKKDIKLVRDFAERLGSCFGKEFQSQHFGGSASLSMEGVAFDYVDDEFNSPTIGQVKGEFHSFLSDESKQDAATVTAHSYRFIKHLLESNRITSGVSTIFENTDGSGTQYRNGTGMSHQSGLAVKFQVVIDRAVGAPGHGKDVVDGLNAVDKRYLRKAMLRADHPEADSTYNSVDWHTATVGGNVSFAQGCMTTLQYHADNIANQLSSKGFKRENERKYTKKKYYIQNNTDVLHSNVKMTWDRSKFPALNVPEGRKKIHGSGTVLSHYHYRFDPDIGYGKCAMRRIPCLCVQCTDQLDKAWIPGVDAEAQPRYAPVYNCKYHAILGEYNNWIIMSFKKSGDCSDDDIENLHNDLLEHIGRNMGLCITDCSFGAVNTDDARTEGFYIVRFTSVPYTLQEDEFDGNELLSAGSLVCDAVYYEPARGNSSWYVKSDLSPLKVNMRKVLVPNLSATIITSVTDLRGALRMTNVELQRLQPFKLSQLDNDTILDEISRRKSVEFEIGEDDEIDNGYI